MPFPGGIDSLANGTLLFSAALAFFYLLMQRNPPSWRRTAAKTGSIGLVAVLAAVEGGPLLLIAALLLSAAGDALLAQESEGAFLGGLGFFLAAHLAYVALFATLGGGVDILSVQPWRLALPVLVTLAALPLMIRVVAAAGALRWPVAAYAAVILAMMWSAASVPAPLVMIGAALFVASDAILACEKFLIAPHSPRRASSGPAVWILYWTAQIAIALAFLL